jgi:hypothetical protein
MFPGKNKWLLLVATVLITIAFTAMALDPAPSGFGMQTLWIAPPLLLLGLFLPMIAIVGVDNVSRLWYSLDLRKEKWKHLTAIPVFLIPFAIYLLTLEPTASLWDCSEFIASAYKLQVPHTPGTPLSLLFGRMFSMLAMGDVMKVAWCINAMSAFFSACSVVVLYYLIHHFGKNFSKVSPAVLTVAALGGSLCLAFSDSFWFSAVEAEIYGVACFFLLFLAWLIIKGNECEEPLRSRVLILIAYCSGLAYCIHPMCLLVLPVLPFTWYMKKRTITVWNLVITVVAGMALVFLINRFIAIGVFQLAFSFDHFFVNVIGLPFYSGAIILLVSVVLLFYVIVRRYPSFKVPAWAIAFLVFGFIPYMMLFIRSGKNPPIDETNPEDLSMVKAYMNRESYPTSPLVFGPYFDANIVEVKNSGKVYYKDEHSYESVGSRVAYRYEKNRQTVLPRLYSRDPDHIEAYREWLGLRTDEQPRFSHNLEFLFTYQLGHMYLRYLMWNFVGREGDIQNSSWLKPWDRLSAGPTERSRNQYWMIPLFLGLAGAVAQYFNDRKGFIANAIFFLMNGLILALYLNSPPVEPRERDYIYVASFIAFSIWIGLGLLTLRNRWLPEKVHVTIVISISLAVPVWMLYQNYDDHNRAGRTFQVDYARAVLNSCPPNAVLFSGGDNDTFPMWYLQEVEGYRTDVRVMVLSYFNTDWYISQLRRPYYESPPLKLTLTEDDYRQYGMNDVLYIDERISSGIDVKQYLTLLNKQHPALRGVASNGDSFHILPSKVLTMPVGADDQMAITVSGNYLEKNALAVLDVLVSNDWKRPLCFNFTSMNTLGLNIKPYLVQEGLIYRLTPERHDGNQPAVDREATFQKLVVEADFSNLSDADVNFNYEDYQARMITPLRLSFNALAQSCLAYGDRAMAEKVLSVAFEKLYGAHLLPSYANLYTAELLIELGETELAKKVIQPAFDHYFKTVNEDVQNRKRADNFDVYLLRQSANFLERLDEPVYMQRVHNLGI